MVANYKIIDNRKYMWDGKAYEGKDAVKSAAEKYEKENFAVKIIEEEGKYLLYTRREAVAS